MFGLLLVVVLGSAVVLGGALAPRLRLAPPIVLLVLGVGIGFIPAFMHLELPAEVVLLLFLPALIYFEALGTSLQEIRTNIRSVALMGSVLVVLTAAAVAAVAHMFGLGWAPAWVLGAAVAPTDATAVAAFAGALPRRDVTVLKAESLINDGAALTVYALAVGATVGNQSLTMGTVSVRFLLAYIGGAFVGAAVAWVGVRLRGVVTDPRRENVVTILVPFCAYLLAEAVGASGVLAVVLCGLAMSQAGPKVVGAAARVQAFGFWSLATYLLSGALFVLVGIELHNAAPRLRGPDLVLGLVLVVALSFVLIAVRLAFLFAATGVIRLLDRRPAIRARRMSARARVVSGFAGFRGAVSLAAALGVPVVTSSGSPLPGRDVIVFVTAGAVAVSIVLQGLVLPAVVRWANLTRADGTDEDRRVAARTAIGEALAAAPDAAHVLGVRDAVGERVRGEYQDRLRVLDAQQDDAERAAAEEYVALRRALLSRMRSTVVRLRDESRIDDAVLLQLQDRLDLEEIALDRHSPSDGRSAPIG